MLYLDQILHTCACQHGLSMACVRVFFDGRGFAEHQSGRSVVVTELVKLFITREPHGKFDQMLFHIELSSKYVGAWVHFALLKEN